MDLTLLVASNYINIKCGKLKHSVRTRENSPVVVQHIIVVLKSALHFQLYTVISDKLVGSLLRARKKGLIDFEGEMLYQRRDDNVPITLVKTLDEVNEYFGYTGPKVWRFKRDD